MPWSDSEMSERGPRVAPGEAVAAVDLGSNSFHMIVAEYRPDGLVVLDRLREMVRLASGMDPAAGLSGSAQARALACLRRFGERLASFHTRQVRAVGTNALRRAANPDDFLARAERELGHPIHVISAAEEARLIYAGVSYSLPPVPDTRLVADIGGGSTELVVGRGEQPITLTSAGVGCGMLTDRYFARGALGLKRVGAARTEALRKLEPAAGVLSDHPWQHAVGASGSIRAVAAVAERLGLAEGSVLSRSTVDVLYERLASASHLEAVQLPGLSKDRRLIFPAGLVVLNAIFKLLAVERMRVVSTALREGLLLDLVGRLSNHDVREVSVSQFAARLRANPSQAERVAATAKRLYHSLAPDWLEDAPEEAKLLDWAARLHEVGLAIAHAGYHRHGAYMLKHAELAGFSREEQQRLALIVGAQRKSFPEADFRGLPRRWRRSTRRLAIVLRLAVLLNRARSGDGLLPITARGHDRMIDIAFPSQWLAEHPLSAADLEFERRRLDAAGYDLTFRQGCI